jgi:hypothetical protein
MNRDIFCSCINLNQIHIQEKCGTSVGKELLYLSSFELAFNPGSCAIYLLLRYATSRFQNPNPESVVLRFTQWGRIIYEVAI